MGVTALLARFIAFDKNQEMRSAWSTAWRNVLSVNSDRFLIHESYLSYFTAARPIVISSLIIDRRLL